VCRSPFPSTRFTGCRAEPEPDIAICRADLPRSQHPAGAELIIEVAANSHARDLGIKPDTYACATADYWVIDLVRRQIICHRDPSAGTFRSVEALSGAQALALLTLDVEPMPLAGLFGAIS
jgi:hypothetical protein